MGPYWVEALLGLLAFAFSAWAGVVWKASRTLADKFDNMTAEFHRYSVDTEHRLTDLESTCHMISSQLNALTLLKAKLGNGK